MQFKSLLTIALAVAVCAPATAQRKKKSKKQTIKAELLQPAKQLKSIDGKTFSYALGVAQGESLRHYLTQQLGVDSAYIKYAVEGIQANLTEDERKQREAFAAGLKIADMNRRNISVFNQQATGKADTLYMDNKEFERALAQVVLGQPTAFKSDSAMVLLESQFKFQSEKHKQTNLAWLEQNKKLKGIKTLPSGLQYRVLTEGTGPVATDSSEVEVHYEGSLIDGTVFDSSYKRNQPATFRPNQVIKGWREALTMMPEGSVWNLYIPSDLGYGERGSGQQIPGNSTLIFKVECLKVKNNPAKK